MGMRKLKTITAITLLIVSLFSTTALADTAADSSNIGVTYDGQVQNTGWQKDWASDGGDAGTVGHALRLEAVKIKLTGTLPSGASIQYKAHVQDKGWDTSWSADGNIAGTVGQAKRLEAVQIKLIGLTNYSVQYRAHVQDKGWLPWVSDGQTAGTTGESKRLEALEIKIVYNGAPFDPIWIK